MLRTSFEIETKLLTEPGSFEGYASTFDNVDHGGDVVERGAFLQSLEKAGASGRMPPMLWAHDQSQPVGVWSSFDEDHKGLRASGRLLVEDVPKAREIYALMKAGAVGGLSIGYNVASGGAQMDKKRPGVRRLTLLDLREVSLVSVGMNEEARVTSVKALVEAGLVPSVRELEGLLRDAGLTKSLAITIASSARAALRRDSEDVGNELTAFLAALHNVENN